MMLVWKWRVFCKLAAASCKGRQLFRVYLYTSVEKLEKAKECTEDDVRRTEDEVQKFTDAHIKKVDDILAAKEIELMEV